MVVVVRGISNGEVVEESLPQGHREAGYPAH